jgi:hypothetical protein
MNVCLQKTTKESIDEQTTIFNNAKANILQESAEIQSYKKKHFLKQKYHFDARNV